MPLPIPLIGLAALAGGYGLKKGADALSDRDLAESLNKKARRTIEQAQTELTNIKVDAQQALKQLGTVKFQVYKDSIIPFAKEFEKVKKLDFKQIKLDGELISPPYHEDELRQFKQSSLQIGEVVSGGITALGSGGLAGLAAYGGVGTFATASTGTAISTLSGAAATNATLAWLGGGSLASGGLGMAGGTAVLGGIVAGPVLAIGGLILASSAEAAKHEAYGNSIKAELLAEDMLNACNITNALKLQMTEMAIVITELNKLCIPLFYRFKQLVHTNKDYSSYTSEQKQLVFLSVATIQSIKMIIETPVLTEEGLPSQLSQNILDNFKELYTEIQQTISRV